MAFVDTDTARHVDAPKADPKIVARRALDGVAAGLEEVLTDDVSHRVQAGLAGGVRALSPKAPRLRGMGGGRDDERLAAHRHLTRLDDPIATLAAAHGPVDAFRPATPTGLGDPLAALALAITGQQLSRLAATAIFGRLAALLGGTVDAAGLASASDEDLRGVGLSLAKARALRGLAERVLSGALDLAELAVLDDVEATRRLVALPGIGPWSAEIFLLRQMRRPDVFPSGDVALRRGLVLLDATEELPSPTRAAERALAWRPFRSYAAAHLWRSYALARGESVAPVPGGPGPAAPEARPVKRALPSP